MPGRDGRGRGKRIAAVTLIGVLGLVWLLFLRLGVDLGTCGEDGELTGAQVVRLCGDGEESKGALRERLDQLVVAEVVLTLLAAVAIGARQRRVLPI